VVLPGPVSDAAALCKLAREHGALSIVDSVTGLGGIPVEVDAWGADAIYSGSQKCLAALDLELFVAEAARLPQLNAVKVPDGVDEAAVRRRLLDEHGIEIGAGLGELAGKIWRIGLMGAGSTPQNVDRVLGALGEILQRKAA